MTDYFWVQRNGVSYFLVRDGHISDAYIFPMPHQPPSLYCNCDDSNPATSFAKMFPDATLVRANRGPGVFHRRIWKGQPYVRAVHLGLVLEERESQRVARLLGARLQQIFNYIEPSTEPSNAHDRVFGHELRSLLILACTEVENACKAVLKANGATPVCPLGRGDTKRHFDIYDYSRLAEPMKLSEWEVRLSTCPGYPPFKPFDGWSLGTRLDWYTAYNETKHDRELELHKATLRNVIHAMGGLYVLNVMQFGAEPPPLVQPLSADEFFLSRWAVWTPEEQYVPPVMPPTHPYERLFSPRIPLPEQWEHVNTALWLCPWS